MPAQWISTRGKRFVDEQGRQVILRGVNLGGDCKLPYPDGGTDKPSDFSDHATVSFIGRPFPLAEADEHLARIRGWGFNTLRFLTTWEAVEHAGPRRYDTDYIEYLGQVCEKAREHGLIVFIDFHQDAWSRMSGGSGAPCWLFDKLGLDYTTFHKAGAVHVMQYKYDYSSPERRQEDKYPTMSWPVNYRMSVNGLMWTAFFAGATLTPDWKIDGVNVQDYLQGHYFGAVQAVARRVRDLPNVVGFDSLNEPGLGWIGQKLSQRETKLTPHQMGPYWTPLNGLAVARGIPTTLPYVMVDAAKTQVTGTRDIVVNEARQSIWKTGIADPFEQAGAWKLQGEEAVALNEDFFRVHGGRVLDMERDFMGPFFQRMAAAIREVKPEWLLFAEINPHVTGLGRTFPKEMPERSVNASHWYDIALLVSKRFDPNPEPKRQLELSRLYQIQLAYFASFGDKLNGGSPTLIGEFGTPYDLNDGDSYARWAAGEREGVWKAQALALQMTYDVLDMLLISSTQWNYTASNRNDLRVGDGWNQEDLSIFSRDQQDSAGDSGGRGIEGFSRPYVQRAQGSIGVMSYRTAEGLFTAMIDADPSVEAPTEIYVPASFSNTPQFKLEGAAEATFDAAARLLRVRAKTSGKIKLELRR